MKPDYIHRIIHETIVNQQRTISFVKGFAAGVCLMLALYILIFEIL